jgi:hypothetical protein
MAVSNLTKGLGLIEAGIMVFEVTDYKEQRAAKTGQGIARTLACCEEILQEKPLSDQS